MNAYTLAQRVLEALGTDESRLPIPRIVARMPDALYELAVAVSNDPNRERRELLRKEFQAIVTSDVADLGALLTGDDYLLLSSLATADIYEDGAVEPAMPLQRVPDRSSLALDRSTIYGYYALEGDGLYTKNVLNNLTFKAGFVPTLVSLPKQLETDLVNILSVMVKV